MYHITQMIRRNVFCKAVPEKINIKAIPITIPGMVFVTKAIASITPFSLPFKPLLAVAQCCAVGDQQTQNSCKESHKNRILIHTEKALVI